MATVQLPNFTPVYMVAIEVQRFDSIRGEAMLEEAVWVVRHDTQRHYAIGTYLGARDGARQRLRGAGHGP